MRKLTSWSVVLALCLAASAVCAQGVGNAPRRESQRASVREALREQPHTTRNDRQGAAPRGNARQLSPEERAALRQQLRQQRSD